MYRIAVLAFKFTNLLSVLEYIPNEMHRNQSLISAVCIVCRLNIQRFWILYADCIKALVAITIGLQLTS